MKTKYIFLLLVVLAIRLQAGRATVSLPIRTSDDAAACDKQLRSNHVIFYDEGELNPLTEKSMEKKDSGLSLGKIIFGAASLLAIEKGADEATHTTTQVTQLERNCFSKTTTTLKTKADHLSIAASSALEKSSVARMQGNDSLADLWNQTAMQFQEAIEHANKTTEATMQGNKAKITHFTQAGKKLQSTADRLWLVSSTLEKAAEAKKRGDVVLADLWNQTAVQLQEAMECDKKSIEATAGGNAVESNHFAQATATAMARAAQLGSRASALEKATEITTQRNVPLENFLRKSAWIDRRQTEATKVAVQDNAPLEILARECQALAEQYRQSAEDDEQRNKIEKTTLVQASSKVTVHKIRAMENALAKLREKTIQQRQEVEKYERYLEEACSSGNQTENERYAPAIIVARACADQFYLASTALEKAITAATQGNAPLEKLWNLSSSHHQKAAAYYHQIWWQQYASQAGGVLMIMEGGYLFPSVLGGSYNGQHYTDHALERMAPETPEIMKLLGARAIKQAQKEGFQFDADSLYKCLDQPMALKAWWQQYSSGGDGRTGAFKTWWQEHGPQPRGILPSTVEAEIAHPGTTDVRVITKEGGYVITVIRRGVKTKK